MGNTADLFMFWEHYANVIFGPIYIAFILADIAYKLEFFDSNENVDCCLGMGQG